jgi:D-glycero-D-manno-heptose 1,7-bisphosphate phosphatase
MPSENAIFLDRDGVINRNVFYEDSAMFEGPRSSRDFELYPWTIPALSELAGAGFSLFIVSNQPNFAKGKAPLSAAQSLHEELLAQLKRADIQISESYYCFHHPDSLIPGYSSCDCRKPSPKFLLLAAEKFAVDLSASWMVGDRPADVECGQRAGVRTIRVEPDHPAADPRLDYPRPDYFASNLLDASTIILKGR